MAVEIENPYPITYTGVFDYYQLYFHCIKWLEDRKFRVHHAKYKDKPDGPGIREKEVKLVGETLMDEYFKWTITIEIKVNNGGEVSIDMPDGSKKKMIRGKLAISITGKVDTDHKQIFGKPLHKKLKSYLESTFMKPEAGSKHLGPIRFTLADLNEELKTLLHLDTNKGAYAPIGYP